MLLDRAHINFLPFLIALILFNNTYSQDDYWESSKLINMPLDSAEALMKEQKLQNEYQDSVFKNQKAQKDSINLIKKNRFGKNAVQLEIMGKSVFVGLAYDRIIK